MKIHLRIILGLLCITLWPGVSVANSTKLEPKQAPSNFKFIPDENSYGGFIPRGDDLSHIKCDEFGGDLTTALATRFDWREQGMVTPVKNQGQCGACYSFAFLACLESKILFTGGNAYDFSENNTKECNWFETGCNGGADWLMASYLNKTGAVFETCDPYRAYDTDCMAGCDFQKTVLDWQLISGGLAPSAEALKSIINDCGPVMSAMYVGDSQFPSWYNEMVYYDGTYVLNHVSTADANHLILIVGWDDTLSYSGGRGAWIVKNSWGNTWGGNCGYGNEGGYCYVAYNNACLGSYVSNIDEYQDFDENGRNYFLDEAGWITNWGYDYPEAWGMCKYVMDTDCLLNRVEFWTNDNNTVVTIHVYDSFDGTTLTDKLADKSLVEIKRPGLHSVQLNSAIPLARGNDIYVAVKFVNDDYPYPVCGDDYGPVEPHRSYLSFDASAGSWVDLGVERESDIGIRIRTTDAAISVQAPVGYEELASGNTTGISWTTQGVIENVKIEYSTNYGRQWRVVEESIPNSGSYTWQIPVIISDSCLVRVSDADDGVPSGKCRSIFSVYCPIWPGDLNIDGIVDAEDILPLVTYWQKTGPPRDAIDYGWYGHTGIPWADLFATYADANGSGRVDIADFFSICLNWQNQHNNAIDGLNRESSFDLEANRETLFKIYQTIGSSESEPEAEIRDYIAKLLNLTIPEKFEFKGNYPNPFNNHTMINYSLPERAEINLSIYNIIGQKVKTLISDKFQPAGEYRVIWDGRNDTGNDVASGLYLIVIQAGEFKSAKTMTLVK